MINLLENELQKFEKIALEDCEKFAFQNRFDTKFVLKIEDLRYFLGNMPQNYSVLQVGDLKIQDYSTLYFDTPDLLCFNMHKNARSNRFKFRTRKYLSNGKIYNEIKKKLNTGKTLKFRQKREDFRREFDEEFENLAKNNGFDCKGLSPVLSIEFGRITLLNKNLPERLTLDFGLRYESADKKISLKNIAIIEIKSERNGSSRDIRTAEFPARSFSREFLRLKRIEASRFSKYCIGICLTKDGSVKKNPFLPQIRKLKFESEGKLRHDF